MRFQPNRADQRRHHHGVVDDVRIDDPFADGRGHVQRKQQKGSEIEERGPGDGGPRREHARRDHGGDRVCRVVETIDVVEDQGNDDDADDGSHWGTHSIDEARRHVNGAVT